MALPHPRRNIPLPCRAYMRWTETGTVEPRLHAKNKQFSWIAPFLVTSWTQGPGGEITNGKASPTSSSVASERHPRTCCAAGLSSSESLCSFAFLLLCCFLLGAGAHSRSPFPCAEQLSSSCRSTEWNACFSMLLQASLPSTWFAQGGVVNTCLSSLLFSYWVDRLRLQEQS